MSFVDTVDSLLKGVDGFNKERTWVQDLEKIYAVADNDKANHSPIQKVFDIKPASARDEGTDARDNILNLLLEYKGDYAGDKGTYLLNGPTVGGYMKSSHKFTNDMWTTIKKDVKTLIQNMYMLQAAKVASEQYNDMVARFEN